MPDWTDQNEHDPGVTLIELSAWLGAGMLFVIGLYAYLRRPRRWPS
ncbi:MAG: hypothetical protein ACRDKK_00720 [Gaiellaceae bacterium]